MNARTLFYPKNGVNVKHNFEPILFSFRNEIAFGWLMFARTSTHVHMELGFSTSILDIFGWTIFLRSIFCWKKLLHYPFTVGIRYVRSPQDNISIKRESRMKKTFSKKKFITSLPLTLAKVMANWTCSNTRGINRYKKMIKKYAPISQTTHGKTSSSKTKELHHFYLYVELEHTTFS